MDFTKIITQAIGGNHGGAAVTALTGLASSFMGGGKGGSNAGLGGIVGQLMNGGLGDQVQSWLGQGKNAQVTPQEIHDSLTPEQLQQTAQAAGVTPDQASQMLAQVLPTVVDKMSPNGKIAQDPADIKQNAQGIDFGALAQGIGSILGK